MRGTTSEGRRGRLFAVESLAGWVFADMLLVLFIVGMASAIPQPPPEPTSEPTPEPTLEPTPSPTSEPEKIIGMRPQPESFSISFDAPALLSSAASGAAAESVCDSLYEASRPLKDERAAFVLIFGGAEEPTTGQEIARQVEAQLECADESLFPADTVVRPYWSGNLPYGQADLEVFTFTTNQSDTSDTERE